ncbi:MAG: ABC-2 type transport system permease protein [Maribacter sp.]|jgi:ABC-2 type transport system permease protein
MLHLLMLEWKKLTSNRTFIVMTVLYMVFLPTVFLFGKYFPDFSTGGSQSGLSAAALSASTEDPYMFPHVWKSLGYLGSWFNYYFLGIIGILIITNEYDYKTLRQSIINGLTRKEYFIGKILIVFALGIAFSLYYMFMGLIVGFFNTGTIFMPKVMQNADIIPLYALQIIGYMSLAVFFGWLFKRFALSLIFYMFYPIVEFIALNWFIFYFEPTSKIVMYTPISAMKNLVPVYTPFPMLNGLRLEGAIEYEKRVGLPFFLPELDATIVSIVFVIVFILLSYWRFSKSDL